MLTDKHESRSTKKTPFPICPECGRTTTFKTLYSVQCPLCYLDLYYYICTKCGKQTYVIGWCISCEGNYYKRKFQDWTSGNSNIDKLLQEVQSTPSFPHSVLEWVDYQNFSNVIQIAKGGFATVYSALWRVGPRWFFDRETNEWTRTGPKDMVLKFLNKSQNIESKFFSEFTTMVKCSSHVSIAKIAGISQDPISKNYIIIMEKYSIGSLRDYLVKKKKIETYEKDQLLRKIVFGLSRIHSKGLIHCDVHSGNILIGDSKTKFDYSADLDCLIADFGLCKPADKPSTEEVYGIMPFIAPEVLRGGNRTLESDVYSFGMIIWQMFSGKQPFCGETYDYDLAIQICEGRRPPDLSNIPPLWEALMKSLWDTDPENRPTMRELQILLYDMSVGDNFELDKFVTLLQQERDKLAAIEIKVDFEKEKESLIQSCDNIVNNLPKTYLITACKSLKAYLGKSDQGDKEANKLIQCEFEVILLILRTCLKWHPKIQKIKELRKIHPIEESQDTESEISPNVYFSRPLPKLANDSHFLNNRGATDELDEFRI